jgi:hypothetical protein
MAKSDSAYVTFNKWLEFQDSFMNADETYYLPKPLTDEEEAAAIRLSKEVAHQGASIVLVSAAVFQQLVVERMKLFNTKTSEEEAAQHWPKIRRAAELRVGDIIDTDDGVLIRNHLIAVEPCERDGAAHMKVTFANQEVRHIPVDAEEKVYRPDSI